MESEDDPSIDEKLYYIKKIDEQVSRKYGVEEYTIQAKFNDSMDGAKLDDVRDVVEEIGRQYQPDDRIRLAIDHAGMDRPMTIHLQPRANVTPDNIMGRYVYILMRYYIL
jgi:hypothetical protein